MLVSETSSSRDHATSVSELLAALGQLHARGEVDSARATMLRVLWLRSDQEDARIATELTHLRDDLVVFHAIVTLANGASASGYAAEPLTPDDQPANTIERSETRAIGRALDILGYIVSTTSEAGDETAGATATANAQPHPDIAEESSLADSAAPASTNAPPMVVNALRNVSLRRREMETVPAAGVDPDTGEIAEPVPAPSPSTTSASPAERGSDVESESTDDLPLADYSWTHFWKWARGHEMSTKAQVEKRLGHSIDGRTPAEVRLELQKLGIPL